MCKSFSISYATDVSFESLSSIDVDASLNLVSHCSASSSVRILTPRTNVLNPSEANSVETLSSRVGEIVMQQEEETVKHNLEEKLTSQMCLNAKKRIEL